MAALAVALSLIAMFALRCLHPPGGAVALCVVLAGPGAAGAGRKGCATGDAQRAHADRHRTVFYNNLTGVRYPKRPLPEVNLQHTSDQPALQRVGFSDADLDAALADIGGFVDLTREDLTQLVRKVEDAARRRSMGTAQVADIMSRDLRCATPETRVREALDLLCTHTSAGAAGVGRSGSFRLLRRGGGEKSPLSEVMTSPVIAVSPQLPVSELIPMLSSQGLHCLPVVEQNRLVGMVTQTDLIAALQDNLLMRG
ncbi:CBS domain-containing protein [Halopseudomonas pachastrellae]|nr:CBS domain-containing protein [Halopseudomonas pachastrellae]